MQVVALGTLMPPGYADALGEGAMLTVLENLAEAARAEWIRLAGERLHTTRRDYIRGIQRVELREGEAVIALVGVLPNLIEAGMPATDLHDTLLGPQVPTVPPGQRGKHPRGAKYPPASAQRPAPVPGRQGPGGVAGLGKAARPRKTPKAQSLGGYYRAIPFRHAGPRSGGAVGQPMGRPYTGHALVQDSKKLGKAIYEAAKQLAPTTSAPGAGTSWGGRLLEGLAPKLKPYHATDIYAGMVREEKTYRSATQSQYTTFRTISVDASGRPVGKSP